MEKMRMESLNLTESNIEKIGQLFPSAITEARDENGKIKKAINFDMLKQLLSEDVIEDDEAYEFTWVGKKESIVEAHRPIQKTLRPVPEESVNWDKTENLYIEGDNLEVLKLLQESYLGKIKAIYIDPPYNTGSDFIYADNFYVDKTSYEFKSGVIDELGNRMIKNSDSNGRFHSDWCSMIYARLLVSRSLLSDDGVIFISIDDNEVDNLKKICDEIFGEKNFVGKWNWFKSATPSNLSKKIKKNIEYILCYEKRKTSKKYKGLIKHSDSNNGLLNQSNKVSRLVFPPNSIKTNLSDGIYKAKEHLTKKYSVSQLNDVEVKGGIFISEVILEAKFKWSQENLLSEISSGTEISIKQIPFSPSYEKVEYDPEIPPNLIDMKVGVQTTEDAGEKLSKMFDNVNVFDYPKPIELINYLMDFICDDDDIVLDFFSGSATTAHAIIENNFKNNLRRKFILVQLPEAIDENHPSKELGFDFITDIGKERLRRIGNKIKQENENRIDVDYGFRVFKIAESNMKDIYFSPDQINQDTLFDTESNIKEDRTDLDLLFGCLLEWGLPLSLPYSSEIVGGVNIHNYNEGDLIACFYENISDEVIQYIAKQHPLRVVFRDSSFSNSPSKINFSEIFKMISPDTRIKVI